MTRAMDGRNVRRRGCLAAIVLLVSGSAARAEQPAGRTVLVAGVHSVEVAGAVVHELGRRGVKVITAAPIAAPPASAEQVQAAALVGQVEASLRRVEELFYGVKLQAAAALVAEELGRSALALAYAGRFDLLRGLHLWQGICGTKLGQPAAAREAFHAAAALDDRALDPTRFPPAVSSAYTAAAGELAARAKSKLVVVVSPAAAELRVDGKSVSGTTLTLVQGAHWLEARAVGFAPTVRRVVIGAREQRLELRLDAASRAQLHDELYRRQQRNELDPTRRAVLAALGRLQGAHEVLGVREQSEGARTELSFERVRASDGGRLGTAVERIPSSDRRLAVQRALMRLWPVEAVPGVAAAAPTSTPVYKRWWFWALVGGGVAVAGGATAAAVVLARRGGDIVYVAKVAPP